MTYTFAPDIIDPVIELDPLNIIPSVDCKTLSLGIIVNGKGGYSLNDIPVTTNEWLYDELIELMNDELKKFLVI